MPTRLYCVAPIDAEDPRQPRLIRATHPSYARRHVERRTKADAQRGAN